MKREWGNCGKNLENIIDRKGAGAENYEFISREL